MLIVKAKFLVLKNFNLGISRVPGDEGNVVCLVPTLKKHRATNYDFDADQTFLFSYDFFKLSICTSSVFVC